MQITDSNGCKSTIDSVTVTLLPKPIVNAGADIFICESGVGDTLRPVVTNAPSPFSFQWLPAAGLNDTTVERPYARPDSTTTYTLIATSDNGCNSFVSTLDTVSTITVHVKKLPVAAIRIGSVEVDSTDICFGDSVELEGFAREGFPPLTLFRSFDSKCRMPQRSKTWSM